MQIISEQHLYLCEWLLLEYMQIPVYYNLDTDTCVCVYNAYQLLTSSLLDMTMQYCAARKPAMLHWQSSVSYSPESVARQAGPEFPLVDYNITNTYTGWAAGNTV